MNQQLLHSPIDVLGRSYAVQSVECGVQCYDSSKDPDRQTGESVQRLHSPAAKHNELYNDSLTNYFEKYSKISIIFVY